MRESGVGQLERLTRTDSEKMVEVLNSCEPSDSQPVPYGVGVAAVKVGLSSQSYAW